MTIEVVDIWRRKLLVIDKNTLLEIAASEAAVKILFIASEQFSNLLSHISNIKVF